MQDTIQYAKRLLDADMSISYIARHTSLELSTVELIARLNQRYVSRPARRLRKLAKQAMQTTPGLTPKIRKMPMAQRKASRLIPATRPFPFLAPEMTDGERIIILTNHGLSAQKIRKYLHNPTLSAKAINKYVLKKLGPAPKGNSSVEHQISTSFMPYVIEALTRLGKDRYTCEICLEPVPKGCIVHHIKYEGATVYDLMYVCGSCNLSRANKGLA